MFTTHSQSTYLIRRLDDKVTLVKSVSHRHSLGLNTYRWFLRSLSIKRVHVSLYDCDSRSLLIVSW